ncbi:hypothetical protein PHAVU_001G237400 [Phaseolus vulgaris]
MHEDFETATKNVKYWSGTTILMPLVGVFITDTILLLFSLSSPQNLFSVLIQRSNLDFCIIKPCDTGICQQPRKVHEAFFFFPLYCISLGTGGCKLCLESFGADQFDDGHLEERKKKMSFFNWWNFELCFALVLSATMIVYFQDFVSCGVAFLIITFLMALTIIAFCVGRPFYRYRRTGRNPLTQILQVLIAASERSKESLLRLTNKLNFLDKAAIIDEEHVEEKNNPWRLATVTRVEETKLIINLVPIWLTSLTVGVSAMNLKISDNFKIPAASMSSLSEMF